MNLANSTHTVTVYRKTNQLYSGNISGNTNISNDVVAGSVVTVDKDSGTGTLTVNGETSDGNDSVDLEFTQGGQQELTTKEIFDFLDNTGTISASGFQGNHDMTVTAEGAAGEWSGTWQQTIANFPVRLQIKNSMVNVGQTGLVMTTKTILFVPFQSTYTPKIMDLVVDDFDGVNYMIRSVGLQRVGHRHLFYECEVRRKDNA